MNVGDDGAWEMWQCGRNNGFGDTLNVLDSLCWQYGRDIDDLSDMNGCVLTTYYVDGIPDVVEVWFSNASIATNYTYRQEFINRFGQSLYNQHAWTVNYYFELKDEQNESVAAQWLSDQFNPFVVENMPPMIPVFTLRWVVEYSLSSEPVKVYAVIHLRRWQKHDQKFTG